VVGRPSDDSIARLSAGDPAADISSWNERINAGEPYDGDPTVTAILDEIKAHHSSYYVDHSEPPAAVLSPNRWTEDSFPADAPTGRVWRARHTPS
jgi:hypothetical protein